MKICGNAETDRIYFRYAGGERIRCIDDNEEALLWRLRMIGTAKESIVLSTFDLRADDNGTKILAALNCAAARGVKIQLLIDGIISNCFWLEAAISRLWHHMRMWKWEFTIR